MNNKITILRAILLSLVVGTLCALVLDLSLNEVVVGAIVGAVSLVITLWWMWWRKGAGVR